MKERQIPREDLAVVIVDCLSNPDLCRNTVFDLTSKEVGANEAEEAYIGGRRQFSKLMSEARELGAFGYQYDGKLADGTSLNEHV